MIGTTRSWRADAALVSGMPSRKPEVAAPILVAGNLDGRLHEIATAEPEDAQLTGMTRSLDRRLLALNLKPVASAETMPTLKVA